MEVIINDKTLSIKHYLNKNLKPVIDKESGEKKFPLYTLVIYETQNTKFKAISSVTPNEVYTWYCNESCEEDIKSGKAHCLPPEIGKADQQIADIINYEVTKYKNRFKLTGLGKRLHVYWSSVDSIYNRFFYDQVEDYLGSKLSYNDFHKILDRYTDDQLNEIIDEALKIYPDLLKETPESLQIWANLRLITAYFDTAHSQMTCFMWVVKNGKSKFQDMVASILKEQNFPSYEHTSQEMTLLIDQVIQDELTQ